MTTRTVKGVAIVVGVVGLTFAASFSTMAGAYAPRESRTPTAGSVLFEGLPTDVVSEVLANPTALANVAIWPEEETEGRNDIRDSADNTNDASIARRTISTPVFSSPVTSTVSSAGRIVMNAVPPPRPRPCGW